MISRMLAILAMLVVSACGDDKDSGPAPAPGAGGTAGQAATGGTAGGVNVGGGGANGGGGGAGGVSGVSQACITCVSGGQCMSPGLACYADTDCQAILTCAISPGCPQDQTCIAACIAQHPAGESLFTPALTCIQANCATDCLG
jgi:hypothetical protein